MTTYEKLGQYAPAELPIAPSNVVITAVGSTTADLEWTNNNGTSGSIILQLWMTNYWLTKNEIDISSTSGTITDLPAGESWRIRVAVLLDGVIYPAPPVVNTVVIPMPSSFQSTAKDLWTATFTWEGYDASWDSLKLVVLTGESGISDWTYEEVSAITPVSATTAIATGYTMTSQYTKFGLCVTIDGNEYCMNYNDLVPVDGTVGTATMRVGGTAVWDMWNTWNDSGGNSQEFQALDSYQVSRYYKENVTLYQNGTFSIHSTQAPAPPAYEFLYTDLPNTSANLENNGDGLFKFTGTNGQYNILIDFPNKAVTITAV